MLRRERHRLLLLASDPAGLAMVPENRTERNKEARKIQLSFYTHQKCARKITDGTGMSPFNLPLSK